MRKILTNVLALLMALSLTACSNAADPQAQTEAAGETTVPTNIDKSKSDAVGSGTDTTIESGVTEMGKRMQRVAELEKTDCPTLDGTAPLEAVSVYDCFVNNYEQAKAAFFEKRVELTGVVVKIGPDIHGKPSIELSDKADGRCYALFVFPNDDFYGKVKDGDVVVCRGNLLNAREPYGAVLKKCELVDVKHPI